MTTDRDYKQYHCDKRTAFYRQEGGLGRDVRHSRRSAMGLENSGEDGFDVACADGCWKFSAVAVVFLVLVGYLIETQPLYIKGISPMRVVRTNNRTYRKVASSRKLGRQLEALFQMDSADADTDVIEKVEEEVQTIVSTSSLKFENMELFNPFSNLFESRTFYQSDVQSSPSEMNDINRNLEDEDMVDSSTMKTSYDLIPQARVAFQTASFYFLIMVFCYIYANNSTRIRNSVSLSSLSIVLVLGHTLRRVKASFRSGAKRIRRSRGGYKDIPEGRRKGGGSWGNQRMASSMNRRNANYFISGSGMGPGLGGASIRVGYSDDRGIVESSEADGVQRQSRTIQMASKAAPATKNTKKPVGASTGIGGVVAEKGSVESGSLHDELWRKVHEVTSGSTKKSKKK